MSALYQYYIYSRIEKRGASDAWCRAGKDRALAQIKGTLRELIDLGVAIFAALSVSLLLYVLTGGR